MFFVVVCCFFFAFRFPYYYLQNETTTKRKNTLKATASIGFKIFGLVCLLLMPSSVAPLTGRVTIKKNA